MKKSSLDALVEAVRFENEGREFFLSAAEKAKNEAARKIFQHIAEDEIRHVKVINVLYKRMKETGSWEEDEKDYITPKGKESRFRQIALAVSTNIEAAPDDVQALEHAMDIEKKGKAYYEQKAAETDIEFEKRFFSQLALEEESHFLTLVDAREFLIDPEGWYARTERSSLDGG